MRTPIALLVALLPLAGAPSRARAEEPPELPRRSYVLPALADDESRPGRGLGLDVTASSREAWDEAEGAEPPLDADAVLALVRDLVEPTIWGRDGAEAAVEGGRLRVSAPEAVHAQVAGLLERLWAEVGRRVRLSADLLRLTPAALEALPADGLRAALLSGRLTAAQAQELVERASPGGRAVRLVTVVRPGSWTRLAHTTTRSWLLDYEVEIAQASIVANPVVDTVETGWALDLRATPAPGGGFRVDLLVDLAEPVGDLRSVDLEADPFGRIDLPVLRALRLGSTLRTSPGTVAALLARTDDDVRVVLLSAEALEPAPSEPPGKEPAGPALARLDLSALVTERVASTLVRTELVTPLTTPRLHHAASPEEEPPLAQDDLLAALGSRSEEAPSPWTLVKGASLWVPAAQADALRARLVALAEPLLATERLVLTVRERPPEGPARERALLAFDVASGLPFGVVHALERAYVADWDVEVAQEARAGDPIPGLASDGVLLSGQLDRGPGAGRAQLALATVLTRQRAPFERWNPQNERTGILERALLEALSGNRDGPIARGEPVRLELGADATGARVEVELLLWR